MYIGQSESAGDPAGSPHPCFVYEDEGLVKSVKIGMFAKFLIAPFKHCMCAIWERLGLMKRQIPLPQCRNGDLTLLCQGYLT
jgi:hypothetical protein